MAKQLTDSTIIVESGEWKVRVYLGLAGIVALVILAFLYRIEAGIVATALGLAWAGRIAFAGYHRHKLAGYERRRIEAETAKMEYEAIQAKTRTYFVEVNSGTFVLDGIAVSAFYPAVNASKLLADIPQLQLPAPAELAPPLRRLVDVDFIHLLVVGPSGSGKSTVLCHLIDNERGDSAVIVLDPHARFNIWPGRADRVIGEGRNYEAINQELTALIAQMDRRYNGLESTGQRILIVADEWLSIRDRCAAAEEFFNTLGSEARKVNMSLVISSISATVDDLAVSGAIRDNLSQLTLSPSLKAKNQALLRLSRRESETIELPGPYYRRTPLPPAAPAEEIDLIGFDAGPVALGPSETELQVWAMYQQGQSLRAISREVFGSVGGRQAEEIKAILENFGVSKSVSDGVSDAPGVS